ncbi:hypothetical protein HID58_056261 [Brassica napus]|uniref:CDP-diacylglycerol--inositol 3-phosphatidyltransferase n=1 Tax=Brassica napus TaxID=3708 RepID=A0ABQ8AMT2_BRANA|nr:hypothetical protein HID58_056261 [Brassica napus]
MLSMDGALVNSTKCQDLDSDTRILSSSPFQFLHLELFLTWSQTESAQRVFSPSLVFLSLLALDIASHWLQMYSTFLSGKTSHKDVKDSTSWLFRLYYGNRMFMGYCCVSCEVLYIILFLISKNHTENLMSVVVESLTSFHRSLYSWLEYIRLVDQAVHQCDSDENGCRCLCPV